MKILLVNSYFLEQDANEAKIMRPYPPLGILSIAAVLQQQDGHHELSFFDGTFEKVSRFPNVLAQQSPDLVGIYANVITRETALHLIDECGKRNIPVMVGGPDPSSDGRAYLQKGAQALVIGEGERTVCELVEHWEKEGFNNQLHHIHGLQFRENGGVHATAPRERIRDLDSLPLPARHLFPIERYLQAWKKRHGYSSLNIITARGCPYHCTWCSKAIFGDVFLQRSVTSVIAELQMLQNEYHPDQLWFADDILTIKKKWVLQLCDQIIEKQLQIPFECLARVDLVDEEILRSLHLAGCYRVWYGGESGSQQMIDKMNKGFTLSQVVNAVKLTQAAGTDAGLFILIGYPGETMRDIFKTLSMIRHINPDSCGSSVAYPIKGTRFYDTVKDRLAPGYSWSKRNENRIAFRGIYPESFYYFAIRLVNNWALFFKGFRDHDGTLHQLLRLAKIMITVTAVFIIGTYCDIKQAISDKR